MRSLWISFSLTGVYRDIQHDMVGWERGGVKGEELPSSVKPQLQPQLPAEAKLADLQPYFVIHPPTPVPVDSKL